MGARICLGAPAQPEYEAVPLSDGTTLELGTVRIRALATPGHTPESVSLEVFALFSHDRPDRQDDSLTGKGKGVFATYASQPVWHQEGGEDAATGPQLVKFQVRPDPLAY